jgi:hypothetical protein
VTWDEVISFNFHNYFLIEKYDMHEVMRHAS